MASVIAGNAKAEVVSTVVLPLAIWLGLQPAMEQPGSSVLWMWPGVSGVKEQAC